MRGRGALAGSSVLVAGLVVAADQLTKRWAVDELSDGRARHVVWTLQWNLARNSGMAFSRGEDAGPIIGTVAIVVIAALLLSLRRADSHVSAVAAGLVAGGAAGNLADRLFRDPGWLRGSVVDFIDLRWWPIFNVADMAITIGGPILLLSVYLASRPVPATTRSGERGGSRATGPDRP